MSKPGVDYVEFQDTANPRLLHVIHRGADNFAEAADKWQAGYRWHSGTDGTFLRSRDGAARQAPAKTPRAKPEGKRGWLDLDGHETPAMGRDRSSLVVRMSLIVRAELLRLAGEMNEDGNETGGVLFGKPSYGARGRMVEITSAIRAAKDRKRQSFTFDYPILRSHLEANTRLRVIGDWHTHPEGGTPGRASHSDRACWLGHLDLFRTNEDPRLTEWLGLILQVNDPQGRSMLPVPEFNAYATRRDRAEGPLTEKVSVQW